MNNAGLLGAGEVRELAARLGVQPTKRLGQNFVIDANTVRRIVHLAGVDEADQVLEVGPGLGSLTLGLLQTGASVTAVEIDRRLAEELPRTAARFQPDGRLRVIAGDALALDELPAPPTVLAANLPYNVSVPVLLHLLERFPSLRSGLVMVQAEVGHRLAAPPGSRVYGAPSVKAAWYGDWRIAGQVSRHVFWPVPNVDSVLVSFARRPEPGDERERLAVFGLVDAAFQQRRKMLRQALAPVFGDAAAASARIVAAGLDPASRGEQLGMLDYLAIARSEADPSLA